MISNTTLQQKILKKKYLNTYLAELEKLVFKEVDSTELILDGIKDLREAAIKLSVCGNAFEIPFEDKSNSNFRIYMNSLKAANCGKVYLWTEYSNYCGLLLLDELTELNLDFGFKDEHSGIMTLITEDLEDKLILDWSEEDYHRALRVESFGKNWGEIAPPSHPRLYPPS